MFVYSWSINFHPRFLQTSLFCSRRVLIFDILLKSLKSLKELTGIFGCISTPESKEDTDWIDDEFIENDTDVRDKKLPYFDLQSDLLPLSCFPWSNSNFLTFPNISFFLKISSQIIRLSCKNILQIISRLLNLNVCFLLYRNKG